MENADKLKLKFTDFGVLEDRYSYINPTRMFYAYFGILPNNISISGVNYKMVRKWLEEEYSGLIAKKHYRRAYSPSEKTGICSDIYYLFKNELLIKVDKWDDVLILHSEKSEVMANEFSNKIRGFRSKHEPSLYVITDSGNGIQFTDLKSNKPKMSLDTHYNDDFSEAHRSIMTGLKNQKESGLYLLHGTPGTGKSTYLRYLIHHVKKSVIFLPPKIASNMDSPELFNLLAEKPKSIVIIEDAENIISSRERGSNSCISMLLNMTDGLLGDSLCIQFICTFNTALNNIDKALLRKGRLKATYEFAPLSAEKSAALLEKRGISNPMPTSSMSLADIYHYDEKIMWLAKEKQNVGFAYAK